MSSDTDGWDHYLNLIKVAKAAPEMRAQLTEAVQTLRRIQKMCRDGQRCVPYGSKLAPSGAPDRYNRPTWSEVRRILLPADILPTRVSYSLPASDPAGSILRPNTIACVSLVPVPKTILDPYRLCHGGMWADGWL